jgi:hypothetical protein
LLSLARRTIVRFFGLSLAESTAGNHHTIGTHMHLAFQAGSRQAVDESYTTAIQAGAKDNGKPGLRFYHQNYYGAFVIDQNGINLEAFFMRLDRLLYGYLEILGVTLPGLTTRFTRRNQPLELNQQSLNGRVQADS